jgi:hypothetical protein
MQARGVRHADAVGGSENLLRIVVQGILSGPLATYLSAFAASARRNPYADTADETCCCRGGFRLAMRR